MHYIAGGNENKNLLFKSSLIEKLTMIEVSEVARKLGVSVKSRTHYFYNHGWFNCQRCFLQGIELYKLVSKKTCKIQLHGLRLLDPGQTRNQGVGAVDPRQLADLFMDKLGDDLGIRTE